MQRAMAASPEAVAAAVGSLPSETQTALQAAQAAAVAAQKQLAGGQSAGTTPSP